MLVAFFVLVLLLTVPLWLLDQMTAVQLMPGLPLSALASFVPAIAAIIVVLFVARGAGLRRLMVQSFGGRSALPAALVGIAGMLAVTALMWLILLLLGRPIVSAIGPVDVAVLLFLFLVGAVGEEIGWTGFATPRMAERFGWLGGALLLGLVWMLWHYPGLLQVGRSPAWIAWWSGTAVAMRVIMVWLFRFAGGRGGPAIVFHATSNLCWQVAPEAYDPMIQAILLAVLAAGMVLFMQVPAAQLAIDGHR